MAYLTPIVKRINVEMSGGSRWYMATAMQNDRRTRYISARLLDEGEPYFVPADADVNVNIQKPDGNIVYNACSVDEDGRVVFEMTKQMLAAVGILKCNIEIASLDVSEKAQSCTFEIEVESTVKDDDTIVSSSEYTALEKKVKEANDLIDLFKIQIARLNSVIAAGANGELETCAETILIRTDIDAKTYDTAAERVDGLHNELRAAKTELDNTIIAMKEAQLKTDALQDENIEQLDIDVQQVVADLEELSENIEARLLEVTNELNRKIEANRINGVYYNAETYMLALTRDGEPIADFDQTEIIAGSGGGTGGSTGTTSVVTLRNLMGTTAISIPYGADLDLLWNFASTMDDIATGNGTAKVYVNGALKGTYTAVQGDNTTKVGSFLTEGTNTVRLMVTDEYGTFKSLNFTVTAVSLDLTSTFNDGQVFTGDATIKFTPIGAIEKTTYVYIDGEEFFSETTSASRTQKTLTVPFISHGVHPVEMWTEAELNGTKIESKHLTYNLCFAEEGNTDVFIALRATTDATTEGSLLQMYFLVYDPTTTPVEIEKVITQEDGTVYQTATETVNRTRQSWGTKRFPTGNTTFSVVYGEYSESITIPVTAADIPVTAVENDLEGYLYAEGRSNSETNKDTWTDGEVTTVFSGMNWVTNGWLPDDNNDTRLKLTGGGRAEVQLFPFKDDLRRYGKTIEIEFMTHDVNDSDEPVISCKEESTGIGFQITANKVTFQSEGQKIVEKFSTNKKVCIAMTVESTSEYRMLAISINGYLTKVVQYADTDNFTQSAPLPITLGTASCGVSVYKIRQYNTALTPRELVGNHIADTADISKKIELYEANDIYDEYNNMMYSAVVQRIPCLTIVGDMPTFKGDEKKNVFKFEDTGNTVLNFTEEVDNDVQGTSSQWYVRKNFKGKFSKEMTIAIGQIPTKVICLKADYAEGTSTHNTGSANFCETLYDTPSPAQELDSRCRRTIFGYPIVVFHQATEADTPTFVGKYNLNYDKGSNEVYGFANFPKAERWEVLNNTNDLCLFRTTDLTKIAEAFEAQYPKDYTDFTAIGNFAQWVAGTNKANATGEALAAGYTDVDGVTHTNDTAEYRLAKFKTEFEAHMDMECALVYYVATFFELATDSRAKNMHLVTWDGTIFEPWHYDKDTIFGINNEGEKKFEYYHEDTDKLEGANIYNGQESVLWCNFREAFPDKIQETYQNWRKDGKLTKEKLVEYFITRGSKKWCANIYNDDSEYKYIEMLKTDGDASNLQQVKGNGEDEHEFYFDNRLMYCDSKWYAGDFVDDYISLRIYTPDEWAGVEPNADLTLTSAYTMYQSVRYKANGTLQTERVEAGVPQTHYAPEGEEFNDTETAIYGAKGISSLGSLAALYCGSVNTAKAPNLIELIIGSDAEGYHNDNLTSLSVGTNHMLRFLNIMNCRKLTAMVDLSGCDAIEEIYAEGSAITGVKLPAGGYLRVMHLPETVANLTILNQNYIEDFQIAGYDNLTTLQIENSNGIDPLAIINASANLTRIRLTGIDWSFDNAAKLLSLMELGGIDENGFNTNVAVIEGKAHIKTLKASEKNDLAKAFPNLEVTYDTFINQHKVTFQNYDGTVLDIQYIDRGGAAADPIAREILPIATPTKPPTVDTVYTFNTWDTLLSPILEDTVITAVYSESVRQYTVSFYSESNLLHQDVVDVYTGATYVGSTPKRSEIEGSYMYYLFNGWDKDFSNVTSDLKVNAVFAECAVPARKVELAEGQKLTDVYTVNEIYAVCRSDLAQDYFEVMDEIEIALDTDVVTDESIVLQVYGFNHYKKESGEEFAHVVFGMKGTLTQGRKINSTNINTGGWEASEMRTWLNETMFEALPTIWKSMIESVQVLASIGGQSATIATTIDKLFLFSASEVGFDTAAVPYKNEIDADAEAMQFTLFTDNNSRIKKTFNGEGSAVYWWLRSADASSSTYFRYVYSGGTAGSIGATNTNSVCFGFCVG
ncbi:MAG: hypothetical protein IJ439_01035 [Tyzzerella sp.]|nr:hypothetical protein [Tyzzerella sp.]